MKKMFLVLLMTLAITAVAMFSYSADGGSGTCGYVCFWDLDDEGDRCVAFVDDTSECLLEEEEGILRCRGWADACGAIQ